MGNGTKALVRDARGVTTDKQALLDAGEKYAMQVLKEVRAGIDLIEKADIDPAAKELAKKKLMHVASKSIEDIDKGILENFEQGFKAQEASRSVSTRPRSATISEGVVKPDPTPPVKIDKTRDRANTR